MWNFYHNPTFLWWFKLGKPWVPVGYIQSKKNSALIIFNSIFYHSERMSDPPLSNLLKWTMDLLSFLLATFQHVYQDRCTDNILALFSIMVLSFLQDAKYVQNMQVSKYFQIYTAVYVSRVHLEQGSVIDLPVEGICLVTSINRDHCACSFWVWWSRAIPHHQISIKEKQDREKAS